MKLPFGPMSGFEAAPKWAMGSGEPVRVLLIDDDRDEATLTRSLLGRVNDVRYELDWVATYAEGIESIAHGEYDAYLIDQQLGSETGSDLVRAARAAGSLAALIMMTGRRDRTTDLASMNAGATDFLMKGRTDAAMLDRTLRYAISQASLAAALDRSREQLACLEELARILVKDGPSPATMERVVDLIADRFSLRNIAIYLAEGETLYLAGQRGYANALPSVSRSDSSVDRVARAGQPIFVPSFSPHAVGRTSATGVATELAVPLLVDGVLVGLFNVGSSVDAPIGEDDHAAIRLIGDRLTAALAVEHHRRVAQDQLSRARHQPSGVMVTSAGSGVLDPESQALRRVALEPLLEVAIAFARPEAPRGFGLLLVGFPDISPESVTQLADEVRGCFAGRPLVRVGDTELGVLLAAIDDDDARSDARNLVALAHGIGVAVCCGYAALAPGDEALNLITAADAALGYARRVGPGSVIG